MQPHLAIHPGAAGILGLGFYARGEHRQGGHVGQSVEQSLSRTVCGSRAQPATGFRFIRQSSMGFGFPTFFSYKSVDHRAGGQGLEKPGGVE